MKVLLFNLLLTFVIAAVIAEADSHDVDKRASFARIGRSQAATEAEEDSEADSEVSKEDKRASFARIGRASFARIGKRASFARIGRASFARIGRNADLYSDDQDDLSKRASFARIG